MINLLELADKTIRPNDLVEIILMQKVFGIRDEKNKRMHIARDDSCSRSTK